ncbi:MAG: YceI family protein [Flavobacteriaceae bacterium]|nr:YceI family protein [Mangrovimonas sp.]MCB0433477.1 YceI family protein [Mangrovimonas sp.]MCB0435098.1 YceI family protein [Mangrovimonas sp.]HPF96172.1 YceI family protein [Mangrovimonas sp.]HRV54688.1 YceI family protein [Mangrovimonas sp.]
MKTKFFNFLMVAVLTATLVNCKNKAEEAVTSDAEAAKVSEATSQKYITDVLKSSIEWKGFKPTGTHNGTISIDTGTFEMVDGQLHSGTFLIDMKSIKALDLEGDYKTSLESHLMGTVEGKEGDFFDVNKFPTAAFEITGTEATADGKTLLSGNLTIKGMKNNITFPVSVTATGDDLTITSDTFTIDRTKWGVNYGSKSIFDNLGDKFINDEIELKINIVASKRS